MKIDSSVLKKDERAVFSLRSLYKQYGYSQYKMSKFEEYDLYVRNKDFLVSDNIITFTDTNGKLMALKPDVTLSIIKNSKDVKNCVQKVYYNENIYRVPKNSRSFQEIMQVGLECIGDIDDYCIYEVIMLALKSLMSISEDYVLDISHMGIISSLIDELDISQDARPGILKCIGEKNSDELAAICKAENKDGSKLIRLINTYGGTKEMSSLLDEIKNDTNAVYTEQLEKTVRLLENAGFADKIQIDFSVINDMNYYNGFVFKGFIKGIASGVLSGGQYDKLMRKMGRRSGAIGFAVYLDSIGRLTESERAYDVDTIILYDEGCSAEALESAVSMICHSGASVMAQKSVPENIRYRQLLKMNEKGVEIIGTDA